MKKKDKEKIASGITAILHAAWYLKYETDNKQLLNEIKTNLSEIEDILFDHKIVLKKSC